MNSIIKKVTFPVVLICLIIGLSQTAVASNAFRTTAGVHVRSSPSSTAKSLTTISQGAAVDILEHDPAGWSKVQVGSTTGYIRSDFLKLSIGDTPATFRTTAGVHVRSSASTTSNSLTTVSDSTNVEVLEHDPAGWSKVQVGSITGYIRSDFLKHSPTATAPSIDSGEAPTNTGSDNVVETRQTLTNVNMRSAASTSAGVVTVIPKGTAVGVLEHEMNGWSRITHNSKTGYVRSDLIAPETAATQSSAQTLYTTGNVNFRSSPSTSANIIRTLAKGTAVGIVENSADGWSKVTHNNATGYIKTDLLAASVQGGESQTRYTSGNLNMRSSASTSSSIIRTLPKGTAVTVLANESGGWSRISHNNTTGYAKTEYLVTSAPSGGDGTIIARMRILPAAGANLRAGPSTSTNILASLVVNTDVDVLAHESNGWSKVKYRNLIGYIRSDLLHAGAPVELATMAQVSSLLPMRTPVRVVDVRTGVSFNLSIYSKGKHADCEPSTRADTDIMYSTRNGVRSWSARPLWVYLGNRVFAASIHGMPHDVDFVRDNGIDGHLCLHFHDTVVNSKSYQSDLRKAVLEAYDKRPR